MGSMLKRLILFACSWPMPAQRPPRARRAFTVGDIRVEGLQRISEGTIYNYLPVNIGDRLDQRRIQEAIRALFGTVFFSDIEMRRDGETLVVVVQERPSIESFEITGNKDIKTEDLQKSLRGVGLAAGKTFDRSVLEEVRGFLTDQYFSRGKYAVRIDPTVEEVPGNKVRIKIDVVEGQRARIRQINLVGNTAYDDEELHDAFELSTPNWLSWYRQDDRYSRESLQGDIEKLHFLLPGPRLRQFRRGIDAGRDRAGNGRRLHHDEPERRRGLQGRRGEDGRHHEGSGRTISNG